MKIKTPATLKNTLRYDVSCFLIHDGHNLIIELSLTYFDCHEQRSSHIWFSR